MILSILAWIGCAGAAAILFNTLLNLFVYHQPQAGHHELPSLSVLIPARNEAKRIPPLIRSLAHQDYSAFDVIILDDHSTDGTRQVVEQIAREHGLQARLRVITGEDLPSGWTGKAWACHQLAQQARGEYWLFTDADTVHRPDSLRANLTYAVRNQAGLLSAWPRQITRSWGELLVVPIIPFLILGFLPMWQLHLAQRFAWLRPFFPPSLLHSLGAANGQFLLFHRDTYRACGGHEAVKDHLVEDVALGRKVAALTFAGHRLINADGSRHVECRMYENLKEVWEGFTKNLRAGFDGAAVFALSLLVQFVICVLPFFLWPLEAARLPALIAVVLILLIRLYLAVRLRTSWRSVWLHPIGYLLALTIALNSWSRTATRGVQWKGRVYRRNGSATDQD